MSTWGTMVFQCAQVEVSRLGSRAGRGGAEIMVMVSMV
jgi:hypothetical protein